MFLIIKVYIFFCKFLLSDNFFAVLLFKLMGICVLKIVNRKCSKWLYMLFKYRSVSISWGDFHHSVVTYFIMTRTSLKLVFKISVFQFRKKLHPLTKQ